MTKTMPFSCSICEEESTRICVRCTKDTCGNHLCEKCDCCSDCCDCEVALDSGDGHRTMARDARLMADSQVSGPWPEPEP